MKQKIKQLQSFLLLLILTVVGTANAWGDPTYKSDYSDFTAIDGSTAKYMWIPKTTVDAANWISANSAANGSQQQKVFINPATGAQATGTTSAYYYRPKDLSSSKHLTFYLTNVTEVSFYAYNSNTGKTLKAKVNGGTEQTLATTDNSHKSIVGTISGLNANTNYTIEIYNQSASSGASEMFIGAIKVTPGSGVSKYSVTYYGNGSDGGTAVSDPSSPYESGDNVTVLANSWTKTGYNFSKWNTSADGSGTDYAAEGTISSIAANTKLYAQWTPATYTITLDANGGAGGSSSVTATYDSNVLPAFDAPIKSNSILKGYYTATSDGLKVINADGTLVQNVSEYTDGSGNWTRADGATLHALWDDVYTVTFDANGGTCATPSLTQESAGANIILPNASKDGYNFTGWYETASEPADPVGVAGDPYGASLTENKTLYARFSEIVATTKFSMVCARKTDMETVNSDPEYRLTASEATITGTAAGSGSYVGVRRADGSKGKFISSNNLGCFMFNNGNLYFHIHLTSPLAQGDEITYSGWNSAQMYLTTSTTTPTSSSAKTSDFSYTIPAESELIGKQDLYLWRQSGSATYFNNFTITSSGSTASTYSISFDLATMADDIETLEEQNALPNPLPTPTNVASGYTFEGWYTDADFTTRATAGATIKANTTLYANYIIDTPTISQNGGAIYSNAAMSLTSNVPFTRVYAQWKSTAGAFNKATATSSPGTYQEYPSKGSPADGDPIDTYNFTSWKTPGTSYFAYMISDGKFFSNPVVTEAFTVKHLITITKQPTSATFIKDVPATNALAVEATVSNGETPTYLWKTSTGGSSWSNASGTNDQSTYTPSTSETGEKDYKCVITYTGADDVETNVVTVTVNNKNTKFTVSFDAGVGSDDTPGDAPQGKVDDPITLPTLDVKEDYELEGWYLDDAKVADANAKTYTPSGNVTLVAKYNCKVTFVAPNGTVSAKKGSTTITSGSMVFEGTEVTFTASPTDKFTGWSGDATGTTNPLTVTINEVTDITANFPVSETTTLFHTNFTEDGWSAINGVNGGGVATNVGDGGNKNVTLKASSDKSYSWTSSGQLTFSNNNYGSTNYIAIPVSGVNGALEITVANGSNKTQFKYNVVLGSSTDNPGSGTSSTSAKPSTVTVNALTASNYVVYIGRQSGSYTKITEITITTPTTKLAADSAQVRILGAKDVVAPVQISTNSTGTVSIKGGNTENTSVATASYNEGTKVLTITSNGEGTTSVVMQITADASHPAKELTIPIKVEAKKIIIKTQPSNISCYQNDVAEKTFTVVATVNTGKDLTYQWYRNTVASTSGSELKLITGATSSTYTLNTADKATTDPKYYFCKISSAGCVDVNTNVVSVTVSTLSAGGTYNTVVFAANPGKSVEFDGMTGYEVTSGASTDNFTAAIAGDKLTITGETTTGSGTVVVKKGDVSTTINVTVKNHTVNLIWSAEVKNLTPSAKGTKLDIDTGSEPAKLPYLTRLYEDGTPYNGKVKYYVDDTQIAYFGSEQGTFEQSDPSKKPEIYSGGGQGGCKFYAYIEGTTGVDAVKASYDLRVQAGYSNAIPKDRKVAVQQQYTLYKDASTKLITITYGGYKYNNASWDGKTDSWPNNEELGKIDGYANVVRNKSGRDAADEYKHSLNQLDDKEESAWYAPGEGGTDPLGGNYQRIKPFRLPCRGSYLMFTAHKTGKLTAYVYQNGVIGRGENGNQLASGPRLGYWFDEEGWVIQPAGTVVTKQTIAKGNGRNKRPYGSYADMDAQMDAYWGSEDDLDNPDAIVITKLRNKYCKVADGLSDDVNDFSNDKNETFQYDNPYYWGTEKEIEDNLAEVVPTPERPIPHQGGYMIVNEGSVKYVLNVVAGKTYYFFGKMTKVGYAGMNFIPADEISGAEAGEFADYKNESSITLTTGDVWSTKFSAGTMGKNTIYNTVTVPSNYRIGKWNTICLPFAVNENQVEQVFGKGTELAIFNGLRHDVENNIYYIRYLRHVDQNILPGQPYLIYPTGRAVAERTNQEDGGMAETGETIATVGDDDNAIIGTGSPGDVRLTFRNVMIKMGVKAQSYGCNRDENQKSGQPESFVFIGTDEPKDIAKYDLYIAPKKGTLNRYMPASPTTPMSLNTYHAFIQAQTSAVRQDAITFAFSEDDVEKSWESNIDDDEPGDPTGIVIIEDEGTSDVRYSGKVTNGKSYNMMGQQVDPRSAKGIVISNGKKIMY